MAVTADELRAMLNELGLSYRSDLASGWFYLPYAHWAVVIRIWPDGVNFQVPYLGRYEHLKQAAAAGRQMLYYTITRKVGNFGVDLSTGAIVGDYFLLLEDAELTQRQLKSAIERMCGMAREAHRIRKPLDSEGNLDSDLFGRAKRQRREDSEARDDHPLTDEENARFRDLMGPVTDKLIDEALGVDPPPEEHPDPASDEEPPDAEETAD